MRHLGSRCIGLIIGLVIVAGAATVPGGVQDPSNSEDSKTKGSELVASKLSRTYHRADCPLVARLAAKARVTVESPEAAELAGYKPCPQCKPRDASKNEVDSLAPDDSKAKGKGTAGKRPASAKGKGAMPTATSTGGDMLKFSKDIAPIFAANCMGCHNPQQKRGEFILNSFENLTKGSKSGQVIVPGKPDESLLVQLVAERKMPRGNNNRLSDAAISKIRDWVSQGALLDQGINPQATLDKIAPTPEQMRRQALTKLSTEEIDKQVEAVGRERWKAASAKSEPKVTQGRSFVLFTRLPDTRVANLLRGLEAQKGMLAAILGAEGPGVLTGPEKISVYVFNNKNDYAEFVRGVEQREVELGVDAHARFGVESPYLVAIDPLAGGDEREVAKSKSARSKASDDLGGPGRSLASLLAEALGTGAAQSGGGKTPRWLSDGLGAYLASQADPRSAYFTKLRGEAAQQYQLGWITRATEVLGEQGSPDAVRALGFSLCEWLATMWRAQFPAFVRGMTEEGATKLDDVIHACFGPQVSREQFLEEWGGYIATHYGSSRRR